MPSRLQSCPSGVNPVLSTLTWWRTLLAVSLPAACAGRVCAYALLPHWLAAHSDVSATALPCCSMVLRACLGLLLVLYATRLSRAQDLPSGASSPSSGSSQAPALHVDTPR